MLLKTYLILRNINKNFKVFRWDTFDLILGEEDIESIFERFKGKFNFADIITRIDEDYMLVLWNTAISSELCTWFTDKLAHTMLYESYSYEKF